MRNKINEVKQLLIKYNQEHLLQFIHELSEQGLEELISQIATMDFKLIEDLYCYSQENTKKRTYNERNITPVSIDDLNSFSEPKQAEYLRTGADAICKGKIAVVTMAGGQGTRLGFEGPKGIFKIGEPIGKTLFQLQLERLIAINKEYETCIPWYIMTSEENYDDTVKYFKDNKFCGYSETNIFFFKQGMLPMIDFEGKVLLKDKGEICFGPDGNGGVFRSLKKSGALQDMDKRGVERVFICGIDNALVKIADPLFIGYAILSNKSAASKSVQKKYPDEKVGVFCLEDGRPSIIEYTEMSEDKINMINDDGQLLYGDANIISHLFKIEDLYNIADNGLQYHTAVKKASFVDQSGRKTDSVKPNAYKYESFIFDAFRQIDDMAILRVPREKEFAPIKSRAGEDSPETAKALLLSAGNNKGTECLNSYE